MIIAQRSEASHSPMSQFAFLQAEFPDIFGHAARAENAWRMPIRAGPRSTAGCALETAVGWLYRHDRTLKNPYDPTTWPRCSPSRASRRWSAARSPPRRAS